jgi:hypothetical protein
MLVTCKAQSTHFIILTSLGASFGDVWWRVWNSESCARWASALHLSCAPAHSTSIKVLSLWTPVCSREQRHPRTAVFLDESGTLQNTCRDQRFQPEPFTGLASRPRVTGAFKTMSQQTNGWCGPGDVSTASPPPRDAHP